MLKRIIIYIAIIAIATTTIAQPQGPQALWQRTLTTGQSMYYDIADFTRQTNGNLFMFGNSMLNGHPNLLLTKLNSLGDSLWTRTYGPPDQDNLRACFCTDADNGLVLVGNIQYNSFFFLYPYVTRVDQSGDVMWARSYQRFSSCAIESVIPVSTGGYILAGRASLEFMTPDSLTVMRLDEQGDTLWWKVYNSNVFGKSCIIETSDGGFIISQTIEDTSHNMAPWLTKIDAQGSLEWTHSYPSETHTWADDIAVMPDGGFAIIGDFARPDEEFRTLLIRTNAIGDTLWTRGIGDGSHLEVYGCVCSMSNGDIVASGLINLNGQYNTLLDRWNSLGQHLWRSLFSSGIYDLDMGLETNGVNQFWIGGGAAVQQNACVVIATEIDTTVSAVSLLEPSAVVSELVLQAYPNPFNSSTMISFTLAHASEVRLAVYDVLGRMTGDHMGSPLRYAAGEHQVTFDGAGLSSGIYFVRMEAGGKAWTGKMMLLR